jgi:3-hydroxyisobutyrate dehydrogenase-like beta-hydroxyacid dehydrogenase
MRDFRLASTAGNQAPAPTSSLVHPQNYPHYLHDEPFLVRAVHRLVVYNRTRSKAAPFLAEGVAVADRPEQASRGDAVITMLSDDAAVASVVFNEGGILGALRPGSAHLSMSTIRPDLSDRLDEAHAKARHVYLSAPVFGRPDAAAAATLFIISAGNAEAIARHQVLFDVLGQRTLRRRGRRGRPAAPWHGPRPTGRRDRV